MHRDAKGLTLSSEDCKHKDTAQAWAWACWVAGAEVTR
jgi:hypothetical protein